MKNLFYKSVDPMKLQKDNVNNPLSPSDITKVVTTLKTLGITHIALSVPMDYPLYARQWADAIHAQGLLILHRPTWNAIEGLYGATKAVGPLRPANTIQYWRDKTKAYITSNPGIFANGDLWAPLPERTEGIFQDATSFLPYDGDGITKNYASFFNGLVDDAIVAFEALGKTVGTGFTTNNYTEIASGWIDQSLFNKAGRVVVDHYGSTHTTGEMDSNLRGIYAQHGKLPIFLQEWANYWDTDPATNLANTKAMFDVFDKLANDGIFSGFSYWGAWPGATESILNPDYTLNDRGRLLQSYFTGGNVTVPQPPMVNTAFALGEELANTSFYPLTKDGVTLGYIKVYKRIPQ